MLGNHAKTININSLRQANHPKYRLSLAKLIPMQQIPAELINMQAAQRLQQIFIKDWLSQAVYVAAKLGIADLLKDGSRNISDLAKLTDTHPQSLYRILRALCSAEIFEENPECYFSLTPIANYLLSDNPDSMRSAAIMYGESWHWQPWGHLLESVKTGKSAFECVYDMNLFQYMQQNPEANQIFNEAMNSLSRLVEPALIESYDFSSVHTLVDIGGGSGIFLLPLLRANPNMQGILFELPHVIADFKDALESSGLGDRCTLVAGDFFESIPTGSDLYILKHILHDWDDERCIAILKKCHQAMTSDSKLLIIERIVSIGNQPDPAKINDLEMMAVTPNGKERTEHEFQALFQSAGFALVKIYPTDSSLFIIEAVCA
jgi:hypothetical protein